MQQSSFGNGGTGLSFFFRALKARFFPPETEESENAQCLHDRACEEAESAQCMHDSACDSCVAAVALPLSSGSSDPEGPVSSVQ